MSLPRGWWESLTPTSSPGAAKPVHPIVAWAKEKPINRWIDILYLAERLAPTPALIPTDATQRAVMIGLSHEICGEMGIGWNRRLQLFAPAYASGSPPPGVSRMGGKYGYNESDAKAAGERTAASLRALAAQLKSQYARGVQYFVGDALSALDIYWTAFANLLDPLPKEQCPMPEALPPGLHRHRFQSSGRRWTRCYWSIARASFASTSAIRWSCKPQAISVPSGARGIGCGSIGIMQTAWWAPSFL